MSSTSIGTSSHTPATEARGLNIYKLLGGIALTITLMVAGPYVAARFGVIAPLNEKAWLVLTVTALGLVIKSVLGDYVAGEFLFHKHGYDNCVMTFGALLTALSLQLMSASDLFPGMSAVAGLRDVPSFSRDPVANRSLLLLLLLVVALTVTVITGAISAAIKKNTAKGPDFLSSVNTTFGLALLGIYVLVLVTKG